VAASPAWAADNACGQSEYSYAGLQGVRRSHGVAATLSALATPNVKAGHVAAWVGVGWAGGGSRGKDEWIQTGMVAEPGYAQSRIYYEIVAPGAPYRYGEVGDAVVGTRRRLAVLEMADRHNWWRVWLDGKPLTRPIFLPGSHTGWEPVVTAESWNGDVRACNLLAYRFEDVAWSTRAGGWWRSLTGGFLFADPGYRILHPARNTFVTLSRLLA
jgi:hypothetical protein